MDKDVSEIKLSVVMPVYNAEKFLHDSINSVLNQTFKEYEFIIINDGSTDKSLEIIETYRLKDERIFLISRENKGLIFSLNEGIEKSKGKFIARMDADDINISSRFQKQIDIMENKQIDICGSHFSIVNQHNKYLTTIFCPLNENSTLLFLAVATPFAHGSVMIRRSFLEKYKLKYGQTKFNYTEDKSLWYQMFQNGARFYNVNEVLFLYRELSNSLSTNNSKKLRNDNYLLKKELVRKHFRSIKQALTSLSERIDLLSHKEMEYLADLSIFLFLKKKQLGFYKIFKKVPNKFKIISIFKLLKK